jgi:heme/copper-type cytochrome/quinol oxidase subunit 4
LGEKTKKNVHAFSKKTNTMNVVFLTLAIILTVLAVLMFILWYWMKTSEGFETWIDSWGTERVRIKYRQRANVWPVIIGFVFLLVSIPFWVLAFF